MSKRVIEGKGAHDLERIIVRLPDGMRDKIADLADRNGRSMTAEVVKALDHWLGRSDRLEDLETRVSCLEGELQRLINDSP